MKLSDFKNEFRLICTDTWSNVMEAWFESVGQLYERGIDIPPKYQYSPGIWATDPDSYWFELFEHSTTEQLQDIAEFLFRYSSFLEKAGISY